MMKKYYNHIVLGIGMMMIGIWLNNRLFIWLNGGIACARIGRINS